MITENKLWNRLKGLFVMLTSSRHPFTGKLQVVYSKGGGLGDELMTLCALQAAQRKDPSVQFLFYTRFYSLLRGAPSVTEMRPLSPNTILDGAIALGYRHHQKLPILNQLAAELYQPTADDFTLRLADRTYSLASQWPTEADTVVLIQTTASAWTPNKQWPEESWRAFIESLPHQISIVEVGTNSALKTTPRHPKWHSLVGHTTMEEYAACFQRASVFVGPVSSGMHLAHGFGIPSVIIVGGYEAANFPYPLARQIGSDVSCAPCWLRSACPLNLSCLRTITADQVRAEVIIILQKQNPSSPAFASFK